MKQINIFQKRRENLVHENNNTLFVISTGHEKYRSHSVRYRFKVASDFYYLTGLKLSNSILLIFGAEVILFQEQNKDQVWGEFEELNSGDQQKLEEVRLESIDRFEIVISDFTDKCDLIAASLNRDQKIDQILNSKIKYSRKNSKMCLCDSTLLVGKLRAVKDLNEIADLKMAGKLSSEVHQLLMQEKLVGRTEREISNWIEAQFLLRNMQWPAYETIVGSGERATSLHARASDRVIQKNELVVVDAGAEFKNYCADITRVIPSGVQFSQEQKEIYEIVLKAQLAAINFAKPDVTLSEVHQIAQSILKDELLSLIGQKNLVEENFKALMPHRTSHWLGLDVHDPCPYKNARGEDIRLTEGMCFTIEPGLYFRNLIGFEKYNQIGIRIEDDVVITKNGCELLTSAPKEIEQIEFLRASLTPSRFFKDK